MEALSERGMGKAVGDFVKKDDNDAILNMVKYQIKDLNTSINAVSLYNISRLSMLWCAENIGHVL